MSTSLYQLNLVRHLTWNDLVAKEKAARRLLALFAEPEDAATVDRAQRVQKMHSDLDYEMARRWMESGRTPESAT